MSLLPYLVNELLEERDRAYSPLQHLFDQNFGSGLFDSDLLDLQPARNHRLLTEPLLCGYFRPWRIRPLKESGVSDVQITKDGMKVCILSELRHSIHTRKSTYVNLICVCLQVNLDVQQFKPEEVTVKVAGDSLVVEGKHEERKDDHGFVSRSFVRRYQLPKSIDAETISSSLSSDGVLQITAQSKALPPPSEARTIPITHTKKPAVTEKKEEKKK